MQLKSALAWLMNDEVSYIDMLTVLRRGTADILYAGNDGVALYERESQTCMISMTDVMHCQEIIEINKYDMFAVHQTDIANWILRRGKHTEQFVCYQAVYLKKEKLEDDFTGIFKLSAQYIDSIHQQYHGVDDIEYIRLLVEKEQMWGLFVDNTLVGFIGEHLEGSMGLLEVFPPYRQKGYGQKLEKFLINHYLESGRVPFCQVKEGNTASFALQNSLGMVISSQPIMWVF